MSQAKRYAKLQVLTERKNLDSLYRAAAFYLLSGDAIRIEAND